MIIHGIGKVKVPKMKRVRTRLYANVLKSGMKVISCRGPKKKKNETLQNFVGQNENCFFPQDLICHFQQNLK